ncbi:hypothetical protein ASPCADRAFT_60796, partial [Aspergillus carbonarius ITEM 5010]
EYELPPAYVGSICLPIYLFLIGWTDDFESVHWIVPTAAVGLFSVDRYLILNPIFCSLARAYPRYAASVLTGNGFMCLLFGAGSPLFIAGVFHNLEICWASTLLGCLRGLFVSFPFVLHWRGGQVCLRSKFARHDI